MKETIHISLSGIAFTVEKEGYTKLKNYLDSIKNEYDNPVMANELVDDIEARITELILNRQSASTPVTEATVDQIIEQMGFPIDEQERTSTPKPPPIRNREIIHRKIGHRLYRNPKGAMLGGVCTGIASYFNTDPVIIRLIFVLLPIFSFLCLFFSNAHPFFKLNLTAFTIYLILWIIIPKARTPRQILEMQGDEITKERIENFIKEEVSEVETNFARVTKNEKSANHLSSAVMIGSYILKIILYIVGVALILSVLAGIIGSIAFVIHMMFDENFADVLLGDPYVNTIFGILICVIPLVMILLFFLKVIFKAKIKNSIYLIMTSLWLLIAIYGTVISIKSNDIINKRELNS